MQQRDQANQAPAATDVFLASNHDSPATGAALAAALPDGTPGNDTVTGTAGNDDIDLSQGGTDIFRGLSGSDYVYLGAAFDRTDRILGGTGIDLIELNGDYSQELSLAYNTINSVEQIYLDGGFSYSLRLDDGNIAAGALLTIFDAGLGAADSMVINASAERDGDIAIYGGAGNDVLTGGAGNDLFRSGGGTDTIDGGAGVDRVSFFGDDGSVSINLNSTGYQHAGTGMVRLLDIESVSGTAQSDTLVGNAQDNEFIGGGGNDSINGAAGNDWLVVGVDATGIAPTSAYIAGGGGRDTIDFNDNGFATGGVSFTLATSGLQDTGQGIFSVKQVEDVAGTLFNDTLTGSSGTNTLYGGSGDDELIGAAGNDVLRGDSLVGTSDPNGTGGVLTMFESTDPGNDTLIGGAGADQLFGGGGNDHFLFQRTSDSTNAAPDTVMDFTSGDLIDLSAIDANTAVRGNQAFHLGATAAHAGDIIAAFDSSTNQTTLSLFTNGDAAADMTILLSGNHANLTASDFNF